MLLHPQGARRRRSDAGSPRSSPALDFLISLPLWFALRAAAAPSFQFRRERATGSRRSACSYIVGVDGISLLLVLLTTLLGVIVGPARPGRAITEREKEYYVFLLLLQTGMLGVFCALDFFLFYVFWEVMLVPMYFLIGIWGGPRKLYAAIKFFLYTLVGSVLMLLGILALYFYNASGRGGRPARPRQPATFDIPRALRRSAP